MNKTIPSLDIDFYADEMIADPFPVYARMRELGSVVYLPKNELYALPRYEQVSHVLRHPLQFVSSKGLSPQDKVNNILVGSTLNSDPPEHDRTRAVTSAPLLPGALSEVEPRIQAASEKLIDTLCRRGSFDAISDFAQYLPLSIVAELVGLPDAGRDNMLKWASAVFNLFGTENERSESSFADLTELRDFLLEYGQPSKLMPGGLAERIFRVGPQHGFSTEKCAQLMRDYIAPSLDTTISTTGQLVKLFADNPEQWNLLREQPELADNAIEEAVRLSTPIRAFTRYVNEPSDIDGFSLPTGARVIVMYASANRDERKYNNPDRFDITRDVHDHLGFGQGVHMCMGMHLARLEMVSLFNALIPRVARFHLQGEPTVAMNNTIRAFSSMPVKLELDDSPNLTVGKSDPIEKSEGIDLSAENDAPWLELIVEKRMMLATDIVGLEIGSASGGALPEFTAGAHIDVQIREGLVRQYSLTGDPADKNVYRLGILKDAASRGGSLTIHNQFSEGASIKVGRPKNHFPLDKNAAHSILIAGGIGITPMLSMAYTLRSENKSFELHSCVRSEDRQAFVTELDNFGENVHCHFDTGPADQQLNLVELLENRQPDAHVYVCGPSGFMDYVVETAEQVGLSKEQVHLERFSAEIDTDGSEFTLIARKSGKVFTVQPHQTMAHVLLSGGIDVPMSCQSGVCGTCLVDVIEGTPEHRDLVQTDMEKAGNRQVTVCCSRSKTRELTLDI